LDVKHYCIISYFTVNLLCLSVELGATGISTCINQVFSFAAGDVSTS